MQETIVVKGWKILKATIIQLTHEHNPKLNIHNFKF